MAYPTSYTEATLATYLNTIAGAVTDLLGWESTDSHYTEAVNEALAAYGTDDIATITGSANLRKLRALARREIWRAAVAGLAAQIDFTAPDGLTVEASQAQEMARYALSAAELDCQALGVDQGGYAVEVNRVRYDGDRHHHHHYGFWP